MLNLVFLGIQGSGKGTQAGLLHKKYGFDHINIGGLLRSYMARKTPLGEKISKYMVRGELVPDKYIFTLIEENIHPEARGMILDGFPRTIRQAEFMEEKLDVNYAIFFDLDDELAIKRLTSRRICPNCKKDYNLRIKKPKEDEICDDCGEKLIQRNDDHKEAIVRRLNIFHRQTKPVICFFEDRDMLIQIDAQESPEQIHNKLVRSIKLER